MNNTREKAATNAGKINDTNFSLKNGKVHIFPFIIRNGYQNVTEVGFVSKNKNPDNYSFFQKVFTGRETITATWEDSTKLNVRDASLGTYNYDFKVGKYYEGMIVPGTLTQSLEIGDVNGNDSFLAMQESSEVTVIFSRNELETNSTDFIPTEDDLYKLYIIPETKLKNKWLYISNVTTYTNPKNSSNILTEVTFVSLKDKLETSGRALEQYVQYAAPGEPYAFPFVYKGNVIVSSLRSGKNSITPVKYLQVELQGGNAFSSVTVFGRRLYWDDTNKKWFTSPSKFLFPYRFANPQANPLNKTSSPTKNFYCFPNETVETRSTKEWLEAIKAEGTELAPIKNMGAFTMSGSWAEAEHTGEHISNLITDGQHIDYFNSNWKPLTWWNGDSPEKTLPTISTIGNVYCGDSVVYTTNDDLKQILIKNSMCNMIQLELPLDMKQTRPYRWSNLSIIGFWTRWFGDRIMFSTTTQVRTNHICYLIDTNIATLARNAYVEKDKTPDGYGNLQIFNGEDAPSMLNPQSANTTICFELSDKVSFTDAKYNDPNNTRPMNFGVDTVYLSQKKDEYGVNLHNDGTTFLLNCNDNSLNVHHCSYGFVIDYVIVNALHIGKIKVSCFSANQTDNLSQPSFTQTVMSNSMFEEHNIRNWTTDITLGCWDSNWSNGEITWPLAPQKELHPQTELNISGKDINWTANQEPFKALWAENDQGGLNHHFNWINSRTVTPEKIIKTGYKNILYEQTILFQNLPGSTYVDRADFLSKVSNIRFYVTGTKCELSNYKCDLNDKYVNLDLSNLNSEYKMQVHQALGSINSTDYQPLNYQDGDFQCKVTTQTQGGSVGVEKVPGGWSQTVIIDLEVTLTGIYIKIQEDTELYGYNYLPEVVGTLAMDTSLFKDNKESSFVKSQIKIPKFSIILKQ